MNTEITATKLKATLLGVLDDVEQTGKRVVVTKHGRQVAELIPIAPPTPVDLTGSVTFLVPEEELLAPLDVEWTHDEENLFGG
jgi:prevent-host-death family protein